MKSKKSINGADIEFDMVKCDNPDCIFGGEFNQNAWKTCPCRTKIGEKAALSHMCAMEYERGI
jgi:hypothetical protein